MEKDIENPNASQESREIFAQKRDEFASEIRKKKTNDLIEQKRLRFNQSDQTNTIKQLFCRDHPGEAVRKIHPTCQGVNLYCFECVLGLEKVAKESLLSIEDFLYQYLKLQPQANEISAKLQCIPDGSEEFLGKKTEITTVVASHIEKEKIEVDQALEKLKQTFIDNLEKKRIEISKNLDDQLVVLDFNFELFTEKINACKEGSKKVHTMETLANQINSFEDAKDLEKFLMLLKNDMDENEEFIRLTQEERAQAFQAGLKEMQNTLSGITITTPTINLNNPAFFKGLAAKLEVSTQKSLEEIAMKNKIPKLSITLVRIDSNIILEMSHMKLLKLWLLESDNYSGNFKLLYRGSKDGNNANAFHQKCDDKGPTVVLIETTTGEKFGGYAAVSWTLKGGPYHYSDKSFLFSLDREEKLPCIQPMHAVYSGGGWGPCFADDLAIGNSASGYTGTGNTYKQSSAGSYLTPSSNFAIKEIEVFSVQ